MSRKHLPSAVREVLDATGLPWELVEGSKHVHLRLNGHLIDVLSRDYRAWDNNNRSAANHVARVRRAVRRIIGDE